MTLAQIDSELRLITQMRENGLFRMEDRLAHEGRETCAERARQISEDASSCFPESVEFGTFLLQKPVLLQTEPPGNTNFW